MNPSSWDSVVIDLATHIPNCKRLTHILGVVETALVLADVHRQDPIRVSWAALLHDCAKCVEQSELQRCMEEYSLAEEDDDWRYPAVWHALVGAHVARERYGIEDPVVLRAIRGHPTGNVGMSPIELVVYIADYVEPTREYPGSRELRGVALRDPLLSTALRVCRNKIDHLRKRGRAVHQRSLRALDDLEKRHESDSRLSAVG